ncbi:MAG: YhcH/YjgK/YiaL family protein [Acidobacteria bacterium]|nr:YhcH/YjgK/YiaL family protein [Acidobacteriota bacterium]
MIYDRIENACLYAGISSRLAKAFEALNDDGLVNGPDGRREVDGEAIYCLVQRYRSRAPERCNLESHQNYIDVQFVASGEEVIRHAHRDALEVSQPYDPASDRALYVPSDRMTALRMGPGTFAVFFPHDAHMPCLQADKPADVHKVVVKVRIDG